MVNKFKEGQVIDIDGCVYTISEINDDGMVTLLSNDLREGAVNILLWVLELGNKVKVLASYNTVTEAFTSKEFNGG